MERVDGAIPAASAPRTLTPEEAAKVVLTVDDVKITAGDFYSYIDTLPQNIRENARGASRGKFAENVIKVQMLAQEARRRKLDQDPVVQKQIAYYVDTMLASRLFEVTANNATITDETLREFYEKHKGEYERVRARHILIRFQGSPMPVAPGKQEITVEEALTKVQELRKRIEAGEDFAEVAKAESDDIGSAQQGGDLGFFKRKHMVPEFDEMAFSLKVGQLSEPVRSPYGFHLIQVEQREEKTLEELKPELEKRLRPQLADGVFRKLQEKTTITADEAFFGGPVTLAPPSPAAPAATK
jgi:parvulin-like peptidyl-prolyl isomerase